MTVFLILHLIMLWQLLFNYLSTTQYSICQDCVKTVVLGGYLIECN